MRSELSKLSNSNYYGDHYSDDPIHFEQPKSKKRVSGVLALIAALIGGTLYIQSTLAANISFNLGEPVEFGQGSAQLTACDDQITVTPISTFVNSSGGGDFLFTSLKVEGIDSSPDKCAGKTFLIKAYGTTGLLDLFNYERRDNQNTVLVSNDYNSFEITNNDGIFAASSAGFDSDDVINDENSTDPERDLTNTAFIVDLTSASIQDNIFRTPLSLSEDVRTITVETFDKNKLSDQIFSSSQVGIYLNPTLLDNGFNYPLEGGNFNGDCVFNGNEICLPYFTIADYIEKLLDTDIETFNDSTGGLSLDRTGFSAAITIKFVYDSATQVWNLIPLFLGEPFGGADPSDPGSAPGVILFDGTTGVFIPALDNNEPSTDEVIFFSLNNSLQSNPVIGQFTPWGDQETRTISIRDYYPLWREVELSDSYIE